MDRLSRRYYFDPSTPVPENVLHCLKSFQMEDDPIKGLTSCVSETAIVLHPPPRNDKTPKVAVRSAAKERQQSLFGMSDNAISRELPAESCRHAVLPSCWVLQMPKQDTALQEIALFRNML
jgi:hypothetical protein